MSKKTYVAMILSMIHVVLFSLGRYVQWGRAVDLVIVSSASVAILLWILFSILDWRKSKNNIEKDVDDGV